MNIELSFSVEASETLNQAFIRLWRLTNGVNLIVNSSSGGSTSSVSGPLRTSSSQKACQRLNYRSWRLLNSKSPNPPQNVLHMLDSILHAGDDSSITLHHEGQPFSNQFLAKRDSLFSNNSKTTLFLHSSTSKSLNDTAKSTDLLENDSVSDLSDISDISEEDEDEYYDSSDEDRDDIDVNVEGGQIDPVSSQNNPVSSQNDQVSSRNDQVSSQNDPSSPSDNAKTATNSPVLMHASDTPHSSTNNSSHSSNVDNSAPQSPPLDLKRSRTSFVRGFNPDTLSVAYVPHQVPLLAPQTIQELQLPSKTGLRGLMGLKVFYIANSPSPPEKDHSKSSDSSVKVATVSSANVSSSTTNLKPSSGKSNILAGSGVSASISSINDDSSAWLSVSEDDEQLHEDKEEEIVFDKRSVRIPVSGVSGNLQKHESVDHSKYGGESLSVRPRSLLSGLFLNRLAESAGSNNSSFTKPSLIRSSTADGIRYNKQGSLLFDRNLTPSGQRLFPARSLLYYNQAAEENKDVVVGISDFNVVKQPSIRSNSTVDIIEEEEGTIRPNSPTERPPSDMSSVSNTSHSHHNAPHSHQNSSSAHEHLSTSLNKYSEPISRASSGLSINNLFLKSSKNLSGLFNSRNQIAVANSGVGDVIPSRKSFVNGFFSKRSDDSLATKREKPVGTLNNTVENAKNELNGTENNAPETVASASAASAAPASPVPNNDSIKKQQMDTSEPPKENINELVVDNKYTKNRSGSIRFSNELSESLKDSILIDRKLGKIPMSEKILPSLPIEPGNFEKLMSDDYHSKGW